MTTTRMPAEQVSSPTRNSGFLRRHSQAFLPLLVLLLLLVAWEGSTHKLGVPDFILPTPEEVWSATVAGFDRGIFSSGSYWYNAGITLWEALLGFVIGSTVGTVLGFALAHWRSLEKVAYPYIVAFQALPKVALAPLLVIWFGFDLEGKVFITSIMTFFPLLVNSMAGYDSVDPDRIDLARSCNASSWQILWKIILPSSLPYLFAGLNVASVLALLGAIVGEFVGARSGLGMLLMQYDQSMEIASVFAVLAILGVIGFAMNHAIRVAERHFCSWAQNRDELHTPG
jgi:NitT/TauT family transport system permease protein